MPDIHLWETLIQSLTNIMLSWSYQTCYGLKQMVCFRVTLTSTVVVPTCSRYFNQQFPDHIKNMELHINALEITLHGLLSGLVKILLHCDNMATEIVLNAGRTKCPQTLMYVRELFAVAATEQFTIKAVPCEGTSNRLTQVL